MDSWEEKFEKRINSASKSIPQPKQHETNPKT